MKPGKVDIGQETTSPVVRSLTCAGSLRLGAQWCAFCRDGFHNSIPGPRLCVLAVSLMLDRALMVA